MKREELKFWINDFYKVNGVIPSKRTPREWFEKNQSSKQYTSILLYTSFLPDDSRMGERIFCILNDITSHPKCLCCSGRTTYKTTPRKHYTKYCSYSCVSASKKIPVSQSFVDSIPPSNMPRMGIIKWIENNLTNKTNSLNTSKTYKNWWITSANLYFLKAIYEHTAFLPLDRGLPERVYCIRNCISSTPLCRNCGTETKYTQGHYRPYCSSKCSNSHIDCQNKKERT